MQSNDKKKPANVTHNKARTDKAQKVYDDMLKRRYGEIPNGGKMGPGYVEMVTDEEDGG